MKQLNKTDYEALAHLIYLLQELGLKAELNLPSPTKSAIYNLAFSKILMRKVKDSIDSEV